MPCWWWKKHFARMVITFVITVMVHAQGQSDSHRQFPRPGSAEGGSDQAEG